MQNVKNIIERYHLKVGFFLALFFPGIFVFAGNDPSKFLLRFIFSFLIIFLVWSINFFLVDFKKDGNSKEKAILLRFPFSIISAIILSLATYFIISFVAASTGTTLAQAQGEQFSMRAWYVLCLRIILFCCLVILIKYLFDSYEEKKQIQLENEILKRETANAQHEVLKQQVNPHFLFNTLNTLKSLVKRDQEQAVSFINEMALVYRYMLVNGDKDEVTIREEMDFMRSYLYLLEIRFGESIKANINVSESVLERTMPPNTMQLLIENAVKHNSFSSLKPLTINIYQKDNYIVVENNIRIKTERLPSSNFGLKNINSRYRILKGKEIVIKNEADLFQIFLPLK